MAYSLHLNLRPTVHKYTFSSIGAKHMNGVAKWNIKTVAQWAHANMMNLVLIWPEHTDPKFWPQAINYATWGFNNLPNVESGLSSNELWSSMWNNNSNIFGMSMLLDAQSMSLTLMPLYRKGRKSQMVSPCSPWTFSWFFGLSFIPSSSCSNVETKKLSLQYHVIFDNKF